MLDLNEIQERIKSFTDQKSFSATEYIRSRSMPSETVKVYVDEQATMELKEVNKALEALSDEDILKDPTEHNTLIDLQEALVELLELTALHFELRGITPDRYEDFQARLQDRRTKVISEDGRIQNFEEWERISTEEFVYNLREHLVKLTTKKGEVEVDLSYPAQEEGESDEVYQLRDPLRAVARNLPPTEFQRLDAAMNRLTFENKALAELVNSDFLSTR